MVVRVSATEEEKEKSESGVGRGGGIVVSPCASRMHIVLAGDFNPGKKWDRVCRWYVFSIYIVHRLKIQTGLLDFRAD